MWCCWMDLLDVHGVRVETLAGPPSRRVDDVILHLARDLIVSLFINVVVQGMRHNA